MGGFRFTAKAQRFYAQIFQGRAEGGAIKGGVCKCEQTQTNADKTLTNASKHRGENASKRKQNTSKRGQTQTNAYTPPLFLHPPFQSP